MMHENIEVNFVSNSLTSVRDVYFVLILKRLGLG